MVAETNDPVSTMTADEIPKDSNIALSDGFSVIADGRLLLEQGDDGELILSRNRPQTTLVTLSGGIDSVYVLAKLLRESEDIVIAHHIHMINREGRHRIEGKRCEEIVSYCKTNYRDFYYTESTLDRRRFQAFGLDVITVAQEIGPVCKSYIQGSSLPVDRWILGFCEEERRNRIDDQNAAIRKQHILNAASASCYPLDAPKYDNLPIISKRDEIAYLGPELTALCWTCREPVYDHPDDDEPSECGICKTCLLMAEIRTEVGDHV